MYIPIVSPWLESSAHRVERRKGGGRGGGGRSSSGKSSGAKTSSVSGGTSIPIKSPTGSSTNVKPGGSGTTKVDTIPAGQPFAGRTSGGGTRSNMFGTIQYGSGYPGSQSASVVNRGFPFGFWPVTFGAGAGVAAGSQYHTHEYGDPSNSSRPGGPLYDAPFQPRSGTNTCRILADNATVTSLIASIKSSCLLNTTLISAVPYNESDPFQPKPEQAIQYYRASSIVLSLDGYNNSAVFSNNTNVKNTPLPSSLDTTFLGCLNQTIGAAAPLIDNAGSPRLQFSGLVGLAWVGFFILRLCL